MICFLIPYYHCICKKFGFAPIRNRLGSSFLTPAHIPHAKTQYLRIVANKAYHRTDIRREDTTIDDNIELLAHVELHMERVADGLLTGKVGACGYNWMAKFLHQSEANSIVGNPDPNRLLLGYQKVGYNA